MVPEISWVPWEGVLRYAYELTKVEGAVSPVRPAPDALGCEIDLVWKPRY